MYSIVIYVPALHRGYIDFFKKYPGTLYIIGEDFLKEVPRMERDIRALTPAEIRIFLDGAKIFKDILILDKNNLEKLQADSATIVMPDEDVSRQFAEKYLAAKKVEFAPMFLRWDRTISTKEFEIPPDRIISQSKFDKDVMNIANEAAEKSSDWWRQIGAVIVKNGKVLLAGYNKPLSEYTPNIFGDPRSNFDAGEYIELSKFIHAEANLIAEAAKKGIPLEGTSIYVTTFPCPVCAKSVALSGIKKVYYSKGYSLLDAEDIFKAYGVEIVLVK